MFVVIKKWDENGKPGALNVVATEQEAIALVDKLKNHMPEGKAAPDAFYAEIPEGADPYFLRVSGPATIEIDSTAQTEYKKAGLYAYLESSYKQYLLQPITVGTLTIIPDDKTLNRLNNKIQAMRYRADPEETTTWIGVGGPAEASLSQLEALGIAADEQWQPYFTAIAEIQAAINSGQITEKAEIDSALQAVGV